MLGFEPEADCVKTQSTLRTLLQIL